MKAKFLWALGAILVFLFFIVIYMPATHLLQGQPLPQGVKLYGISGTILHGRAHAIVIDGIPVTDIEWEIAGFPLLIGQISADIKGGNLRSPEEVSFKGEVSTHLLSPETVQSSDFLLFMPVDRVLAGISLPLPVNAGGRFRAQINDLSFGPDCNTLSGTGSWLNATVAGTRGPIDFGNYSADLRCEGNGVGIAVKEPNKLGLTLNVVLQDGFENFTIDGRFKIDASLPSEVHDAAAIFGPPGEDGYTLIKL